MPWDVKWFLRSEARAISDVERQALLAHAKEEEARPYQSARYVLAVIGGNGAVAGGGTQVPEDLAHPDWALLLAALTALRAVVPGTELRIEDSLGLISWNAETNRYETRGWERAPTPEAPPPPPEDELDAPIRAALTELTTGSGDRYAQRQALAAQKQPERVARLGMALLPTLPKDDWPRTGRNDLAQAIFQALEKIEELPPAIEEGIRTLWQTRPDTDVLRHLATALEPVAGKPPLLGLLRAALEAEDTDADTLNCVCQLLSRARSCDDEMVPVLVARARRDRSNTWRDITWRERLLCALEFMASPAAFATVLLDADADRKVLWRAASAMAKCDPARALPSLDRMKDCPGISASAIARVLGDLPLPTAVESLRRYLDHGETATRVLAASAMLQHGRLPEVAAVWRTLDAAGYRRDNYQRDRALRAFDIHDSPATVDWDALVRARGGEPLPLPALPTALEGLTHPNIDARSAARSVIEDAADPQHLLAIALTIELEHAIGKLGAPRGYPSFWRWRTFLTSLGCESSSDEKIIPWVRENLERLPQQALSPELVALRDGDIAAAAVRYVVQPFALTAEERAALDAEEAGVAAKGGLPKAPPDPIEAQDLFSGPHPEAQGPAMDSRGADQRSRPEPNDVSPERSFDNDVVELLPGEALLSVNRTGALGLEAFGLSALSLGTLGAATMGFRAALRSRTRWLRLDAVEVTARDSEGAPIINHSQVIEQKLNPVGRVALTAFPTQAKLKDVRSADVHAIVRRPFQILARRYELPAFVPGATGRVALKSESASELVRASASAYLRDNMGMPLPPSDRVELDLLVEVALGVPTRTVAQVEVVVALRGVRGAVLSSRQVEIILPADGSPVVFQQFLAFDSDRAQARYLEIAVRGALTQRLPLCVFQIPG